MSMPAWRRGLLKAARLAHLYLSLFALALVLFFSATGFMLNHEDWFVPADSHERVVETTLPPELLAKPDRLGIVEALRRDGAAVGLLDSFEPQGEAEMLRADEWRIVFKRPGTEVEALVRREDGTVAATIRTRGVNAMLLDLHRGKATGKAWSFVIDAVCVALTAMSATGLVLWSSLKSRGRAGLLLMGLGFAAGAAVVWWCAL